jgi:hypothetical protein
MERCLSPSGPYHVAGLGPAFWSAALQGTQPARLPAWTPATLAGLRRLGMMRTPVGAGPAEVYAAFLAAYGRIQAREPALSALHVDHFLTLVAAMRGRTLRGAEAGPLQSPVTLAVQQVRAREPLRQRLKERGETLAQARRQLEEGLKRCDGQRIGAALAAADPIGSTRAPLEWGKQGEALALWVGRLWEADDPYETLAAFWNADPLPGAGLWLPAAVLHLRDSERFHPWNEQVRRGYATLEDSADGEPVTECYRLFNEGMAWLRERHRLHPLETPAVVAALAPEEETPPRDPRSSIISSRPLFGGFCPDTFQFLAELAHNNRRDWMERQRNRYAFSVRGPLVELCRALAARYVEPVLRGTHSWSLDTEARSGRALTSICKNAYGRTLPYNTALWITFCRREPPHPTLSPTLGGEGRVRGAGPRNDAQLFVRLDAEGLRFGLRLGRKAHAAITRFRQNVEQHGELLYRALREGGALAECRFGPADDPESAAEIHDPADLRTWAGGRSLEAARTLPADSLLLTSEELVGEILLTFDRLLPAYACSVEEDPVSLLAHRAGAATGARFTEDDFRRSTHLGDDWLRRARHLLDLKRQLILQGVPGTGKTHVARGLARLLTGGREEFVRLVQFHPAYSYEEFVEGIKVKSVEVNGRHDVTYPVEDGLLCTFAAEAASRPAEPHVLVIDEINRGNLPRIFGELLYLLEYRDQAIGLPYSRRGFRLPANLYLIGTMNAADRSVALIDQALRRRFSFLEMPPDAGVLRAWLTAHVPAAGRAFADKVVVLFERLNVHLAADLGPRGQVGHSYFMVPDLDESRLRVVWQHHVRPLLEEYFAGQPGRVESYDLDRLLTGDFQRPNPRRRQKARA